MALVFPLDPSIGSTYQSGSSNTYEWTGTYWKIKNITSQNFVTRAEYTSFSSSVAIFDNEFATTGSNQFKGKQTITGSLDFGQQSSRLAKPHSTGSTDLITLWDFHNGNPSGFNYAIGVEPDHVWFTMDVPTDDGGFKFYSKDNELLKIGGSGTLFTSGSIIPATGEGTYTSSFSLGSPTNAWKDLYISHGSIIFVDAQTQETSSFSIDNNAGVNTVKYTAGITASLYTGDGGGLYNLPANTNWNKDKNYILRNTEQFTFSGDYILENSTLYVEGTKLNSIGEWTSLNVDGDGTITRTGNNTYRIDGPNDNDNSGWLFIKRFFDTPTTMSIGYEWFSDDGNNDWPMYEINPTEQTGEMDNTNRLINEDTSHEFGTWTIEVPANNWLAIGVYSNDSCCGSGSLHLTLPYILNEDVQYSPNKYFKQEGSIFIGGNLLLKDSLLINDGKISVGGEVILIGDSQIEGTGTII